MPLTYKTNGDWDNFLTSAKKDTAAKYHQGVVEEYALYCLRNKYDILAGLSFKTYMQFRHDTLRLCKRDNRRYAFNLSRDLDFFRHEIQKKVYSCRRRRRKDVFSESCEINSYYRINC
jgi:hypothetical protein